MALCGRLALLIFVLGYGCVGLKYEWRQKHEYDYNVEGQSVVGFQGTEHEGFEYRGKLTVHSFTGDTLYLKLREFTFNKYGNKTLAPLPVTSATVALKLFKSREPSLSFPSNLADWQVNFIKGLVSFITVSYEREEPGQKTKCNNGSPLDETTDVYSTTEDTVVGRCQVLYEVNEHGNDSPVPNAGHEFCSDQPVVEIVKTVNYSNCEQLNEDTYGLPNRYNKRPDADDNIWRRASSARLLGCGTKASFVLLSSISESEIIARLHLRNNSESQVYSRLNVTLLSMQNSQTTFRPSADYQTVSGLQYHYECESESSEISNNQSPDGQTPTDGPKDNKINKERQQPDDKPKNTENDDGLIYERRRRSRSVKKVKKFPKYSQFAREYDNDDDVWNWNEVTKMKLSDSNSSAPQHRLYTAFFLAHRFALGCRAAAGPSPYSQLTQLLDDIVDELSNATAVIRNNTLEKISIATDYVRLLSLQDLESLSKTVFEDVRYPEHETREAVKRRVFRDVVTFSGQRASFKLISNWIKKGQTDGEEAAQIVSALPSHLVPSDAYILREFYDLMEAVYNGRNHQLKITTILGFSNYVRVSAFPVGVTQEIHDVVKYVDWLKTRLSDDENLELAIIRAIGNMPGEYTVSTLKSLAMENRLSVYKRSTAVFAMIYSALYCKSTTTTALLTLYHNATLPTAVRVSAVSLLFYSTKDISVWQRIALSTWTGEPSPVVSAFVWNTLQNLASNHDEKYSFQIKAATQVKRFAKPPADVVHQPFNIIRVSAVYQLNTLISEQIEWLDFNEFQSLYYRHSTSSSGLSRPNLQVELAVTNFYGFLYDLLLLPEAYCQNSVIPHSTQWIKHALNIKSRAIPSFEAHLQLKIHNLVERMFSMDKKSITDLSKELIQLIIESTRNGKEFYYQKSGMMMSLRVSTITEMGFPVDFRVNDPWSMRTSAGLQIHQNSFDLNTTFMYASQKTSDMSVYTNWDHTQYTVGVQTSSVLQLPHIYLTAQYDKNNNIFQIKIGEIKKTDLIYRSNTPFSVRRLVQYPRPTIIGVHGNPLNKTQMNKDYTAFPIFPLEITIERESSAPRGDTIMNFLISEVENKLSNPDISLLSRSTAKSHKYEVTMGGLQPMAMNFSIGYAVVQNGEKKIMNLATQNLINLEKILSSFLSDNSSSKDGQEPATQYLYNKVNTLTAQEKGPNTIPFNNMVANINGNPTGNTCNCPLGRSPEWCLLLLYSLCLQNCKQNPAPGTYPSTGEVRHPNNRQWNLTPGAQGLPEGQWTPGNGQWNPTPGAQEPSNPRIEGQQPPNNGQWLPRNEQSDTTESVETTTERLPPNLITTTQEPLPTSTEPSTTSRQPTGQSNWMTTSGLSTTSTTTATELSSPSISEVPRNWNQKLSEPEAEEPFNPPTGGQWSANNGQWIPTSEDQESSNRQWSPNNGQWSPNNEQWPANNGKWPSNNGQWPSNNGQWPPNNGQWPSNNGQWSPKNGQLNSNNGQWPSNNGQWNTSNGQWPSSNGQWNSSNGQWPSTNGQLNFSNGQWPSNNGQWNTSNGQWPSSNGQWNSSNGQWPSSNGQWNSSNGQWPSSNGQWSSSNGQWNYSNGQWPANNGQWPSNNGQWNTSNGQWSSSNGQWNSSNGQLPVNNGQWPANNGQWPPNNGQWPHFGCHIKETTHSTNYSSQLDKVNASSGNPFGEHVSSASDYALLTVLDGLQNGKAYAADFNFTMGYVKLSALFTRAFTLDNLLQRAGAFVKKGDDLLGGLTVTITKPVTPLFDVRDFVDTNPKTDVFVDFTLKDTMNFTIQGTMSPKGVNNNSASFDIDDCVHTIPGKAIGPECRNLIHKMSSYMGRFEFNISGHGNKAQKQFCLDINSTEDDSIDMTLPNQVHQDCLSRVNFLPYLPQMLISPPGPAYCGITTKRVRTFDKAEYFFAVSRSWHLAAKDCSGQRQVAILTRSSPSNTALDIEVNVGNSVILTIESAGGVSVNGQHKVIYSSQMYIYYDNRDVELMRVYRSTDNAIGVQLPMHGFDITYAYSFFVINANPSMRGRLCGLCGSYTNEGEENYMLPDGNRAESIDTFGHSYDLRN